MFGVKRPYRRGGLALLVLAGLAAAAAPGQLFAADPASEFKQVYEAYERELAGRHYAAAIPYAEQALNIARQNGSFGDDFTHTLIANLGKTYFMVGRWADAARTFDSYLAVRQRPGRALDEYLSVLLQDGTASRALGKPRKALPLLRRALEYLGRRDKERRAARADTLNQITLVMLDLKQPDKALAKGEEAHELYEDLYGRKDVRTLEALLTLARTEVLLLKNDRADQHLKRMAQSLHHNADLRDWQKSGLHARIAALYEKMEDKFKAEKHRNMANAFLRGVGDVELKLRTRAAPEYPRKALEAGITGTVEVEYTVRKDGDVDNIRIIKSTPPGIFDSAVIKAMKKWQYTPPKQNGERVDFHGVRKAIEFRKPS